MAATSGRLSNRLAGRRSSASTTVWFRSSVSRRSRRREAERPRPAEEGQSAPTAVQSAAVGLSFLDGAATIERANVVTQSYSASAGGWVGLLDGGLNVNGTLKPGAPSAPGASEAPFIIEGTLASPVARLQALAN